ncbi:MAG: hypothetical protein JNM10_02845 [Planctomycetia bacterium]|nr:hypothetical protein [Planctomycetia bacterium]
MRPRPRPARLATAALVACGALQLACSKDRARRGGGDPAAEVTARCSFDEAFPADGPAWRGAGARLERRGPASHPRTRLVVDARDASGAVTEYLVDTGTSCAFLSTRAPAAAAAAPAGERLRLMANEGATAFDGRDAVLPRVDLGGLVADGVPVFLVEREHSLHRPANVLGMAWMAGLVLDHDAASDAWTLRRPARDEGRGAGTRGPGVAMAGPGFPVVTVLDDAGRRVHALVDTGAPMSLYGRAASPGRYRLVGDDGRVLLAITAREPAPWVDLAPRGLSIAVWIGLDDLARASFTLDFAAGRWTFRPVAAPPPPR